MSKQTIPITPGTMQDDINGLKARMAAVEAWIAWFKGYLAQHPGGVALTAVPPPGEGEPT